MPISKIGTSSIDGLGYGFKNRIINGGMGIWQRGTSVSGVGTGAYLADRWQLTMIGTSLNCTMSQDTSVPNTNYLYSLKVQQLTSNATSVSEYAIRQRFELANVRDLAGSPIAISFWYRSNVTGTHGVRVLPLGSTGGVDSAINFTVNAANTWEYKTITSTALSALTSWGSTADNAAALILDIGLVVGGQSTKTISANDYCNVTGVQLEKGPTATSFDYRPYGTELALCQRYYEKSYDINTAPGTNTSLGCEYHAGSSDAGSNCGPKIIFKVTKRTISGATFTAFQTNGTSGSWVYGRSGTSGTGTPATALLGESGGLIYIAVGAAYVPTSVIGQWTISCEL